MVRARKTGFASHLKKIYFKEFKNKDHHSLQDAILKLSNHHMAAIDEIVNKAAQGKPIDNIMYPSIDIGKFKDVAKKLVGHTHSQVQLARRHRELKGSGLSIETLINGARTLGNVVSKFKGVGKVMGKVGQWAIDHPTLTMMGLTAATKLPSLISPEEEAPAQREQVVPQTKEVDELLADTSGEESDEKQSPKAKQSRHAKENPRRVGRGLANRWVI